MDTLGLCIDDGNWKNFKIYARQDLINDNCPIKILKEILIHEIIHTCPRCFIHGKTFHKYVKIMEDTYGYNLWEMKDDDSIYHSEKPIVQKYICPKCGSVFYLRNEKEKILMQQENMYYKCIFCHSLYQQED